MAEAVHRNALQPGFEVLWYRIERILGQGGFGITYLAYDTNLDQQVAIKEYLPIELAVREGDHSVHPVSENHGENFRWGLTRFIAEARTLAKFDHPNIVRVLSVFEQNNTAYMPMRYESGSSLQELLPRRGTLEEGQLMKILLPVLAGLRLVHEAGFVHRDIKPANIFIRDDGSPVLLDFGSARQSLGAETKTLTSLVSPGYAPFEQYYSKSDRQGPWTDLYGLGATMYRAVAGVPPMDAVDRSEGLLKNAVDPIVPVSEIGAGRYSRRFLDAIDRAIRFDEKARPQSAQEWLVMFEPPDPNGLAAAQSDSGSGGPGIALVPANTPVAAAEATAAPTEDTIPLDPDPGGLDATGVEPGARTAATEVAATTTADPASLDERYAACIGPTGAGLEYYRSRFVRFDERGLLRRLSWSWPGALCTFLWMVYRRLYLWAFVLYPAVTIGLTVAVLIVLSVVSGGDVPDRLSGLVLLMVAIIWPGLYANAIYHRRARTLIARLEASEPPAPKPLDWLAKRGGTSRRALTIAFIVTLLFALLVIGGEVDKRKKRAIQSSPTDAADSVPLATDQAGVAALLEAAKQDIESLRLTTPPGNNALEKLRQAQALAPDDARPAKGIEQIGRAYVGLGDSALEHDQIQSAIGYYRHSLEVVPENAAAKEGLERTVERIKQLGTREAERGDLNAAERYLRQALEVQPDSAELRRIERRLKAAKAKRRKKLQKD